MEIGNDSQARKVKYKMNHPVKLKVTTMDDGNLVKDQPVYGEVTVSPAENGFIELQIEGTLGQIAESTELKSYNASKVQQNIAVEDQGWSLIHSSVSEVIGPRRMVYLHFKHNKSEDYATVIVSPTNRYSWAFGNLNHSNSTISGILRKIPAEVGISKRNLYHQLNGKESHAQVLKSCVEILEKEGYIKRIMDDPISEEATFIRTGKQAKFEPQIQRTVGSGEKSVGVTTGQSPTTT